jgi:FAD/FMN-containing dehydrogenase
MDRTVSDPHISFLKSVVGASYVLTDPKDLETYGRDWTKVHTPDPLAVVMPANTEQVSAVVRYCRQNKIPVVPSGGRTGLAGGCVAAHKELVLSLGRMNRIEKIDCVGMTAVVEAGVTLQQLQEAAAEKGVYFALDLAAKGSCHIGGNIATNAGGVKFVRFGGMRDLVLGLEIVLPDGDILDMNLPLRKNNTGYDLKQLFIGSEGTLGIITRATVKLSTAPGDLVVSLMAASSFADVPKILERCNMLKVPLTAFEFFGDVAHDIVLRHNQSLVTPFAERHPCYVLMEVEAGKEGQAAVEPVLEDLFENGLIADAVIAGNAAQFSDFWAHRENISESIANEGFAHKNDISVPIDTMTAFISELTALIDVERPEFKVVIFGHIADGNLHLNYVAPKGADIPAFRKAAKQLEQKVFALIRKFGGSISAEHGIGLLKKADLSFSRSPAELNFMKQIRKVFDPDGLMNPGKIFE